MTPTRKQFHEASLSAKPGDVYQIKRAASWERFKGWGNYRWEDAIFLSYDGKEAVFQSRLNRHQKFYITHRMIKLGEVSVIWDRSEVFAVNKVAGNSKNNSVALWEPGKLKHY